MLSWREIPFVRLLAVFITGILSSFVFNFFHVSLFALLALFALAMPSAKKLKGQFRYRWVFGVAGSCYLLLLGYLIGYHYDERNKSIYFGEKITAGRSIVLGTIKDAPIKKGNWVKVVLMATNIGAHIDSLETCSGNILVYLSRDSASEKIAYGDIICLNGKIEEVRPPDNPHSFNYQRYLHFKNIHHQAFIRAGDWDILEHGNGNILFRKAIAMQGHFLGILKKHLKNEKELAVGSALILGYRDEIPEVVQTAYSQTGAMHVLAVSGLHVGIIFLILNFFLKKIKINTPAWRLFKVLIILLVIWAFALVTGASPSVMRAAVMFSFLNIGLAFQRYSSIYNTLAASAFFILLVNPYLVASVGFQLSYLAVFGIVYFQPKIVGLWKTNNKIVNYAWQLTGVSLAAQITTLPLTFYYFNQLPVYFWLTGLILVPLAGFELGAGIALLLLETIFPPLAIWIGKLLGFFLWFGNECVFYIQHFPAAVVEGIWIGGGMAILLYFFITSTMLAIASKKYRWVMAGFCFLFFVSLNFAFSEIKNCSSRQLVIYKIYKHSAIDFFDGKKLYTVTNLNVEEKPLGFATAGHRYAMGVESPVQFYFEDTTEHIYSHLIFKNNFVQFYDKKIMIIDELKNTPGKTETPIDYILIRNSPAIDMDDLGQAFNFKKIIFDNSNKKWKVEKWKEQCKNLNIEYYDIAVEGAFILDLNS